MKKLEIDEIFKKAVRGPQIITRKDLGIIVAETGVRPGWKVVDAGTGSGFLAMFLANLECEVYTYENDKRWFEIAQKNFKDFNFKNIHLKFKNVLEGIEEENVDMITIDMKDSQKLIENAYDKLREGGYLVFYSLHIEQMQKIFKELRNYKFSKVRYLENIQREWQIEGSTYTRPKTEMLGHTGFLIFARK
jgi:tRNA (adenine57-N1/adenine58-N1)-methyltransferase